ncbi:putative lipase (class 3) [Lyophyllum shimeji]|uniref:triacylglycerol lipase n=1 Tax=Lyophyllum shimeji TaxID=47721 RepID=A0A9P3PGP8_LYOSH|nr:putative lipase (class 3) [Lyophyllum shimeji]
MLQILPTALRTLIVWLLWSGDNNTAPAPLRFQLRHEHGVTNDSLTIFANTPPSLAAETYDIAPPLVRRHSEPLRWTDEEVKGPNVQQRETLLQLAKMTYNSYVTPKDSDWYDLGRRWNASFPFGWEPDADGFRGHIFVSEDNSTVIVTVKGTSAPLFYPIGINLYNNVTYMYPEAHIWMIGHSLGGALASLIGVTFGAPVVAFEAPGEKRAATRLHLPSPPSTQHITHVYHTGDPIPLGACTGVTSVCAIAATPWKPPATSGRPSGTTPSQAELELLNEDWDPENGMEVPPAEPEKDCVECYSWEFGDYKNVTRH